MQRERDTLTLARVIGDVLDPFTRSINLRVAYNNRKIRNGCDLRPSKVINQPKVEVRGDDLRTLYTLVYNIYTIHIQLYTYSLFALCIYCTSYTPLIYKCHCFSCSFFTQVVNLFFKLFLLK